MAEKLEKKRTMTMDFDSFVDDDEDFFDAYNRASAAAHNDLLSDSEDDDFEDSRMSFSSVATAVPKNNDEFLFPTAEPAAVTPPKYDVWMAVPGSIRERRKRLFVGMGLESNKQLVKENSINFSDKLTRKFSDRTLLPPIFPKTAKEKDPPLPPSVQPPEKEQKASPPETTLKAPVVLVRSKSDGNIDVEEHHSTKQRKLELTGEESTQRLKRTYSLVASTHEIALNSDPLQIAPNGQLDSCVLVKDLENGSEVMVNECDQTGKKVNEEEPEKSVGYSPVVKELMRRETMCQDMAGEGSKKLAQESAFSKSIKLSKIRGASLFTKISMNFKGSTKAPKQSEKDNQPPTPDSKCNNKKEPTPTPSPSQWVKVKQTAKTHKDLSAVHMCQEIQAHEGSIWTMRFTADGRYLASAGEDKTIHIWEVQECEVTSSRLPEEGSSTPLHPSASASPVHPALGEAQQAPSRRKKKWGKKSAFPAHIHVPDTVFALSEKPACSFTGHTDDVLDLSWSKSQLLISSSMDKTVRLWDMETKSCLKTFSHNDYVTGIHFNPVDDNFFISGSLDGKVRIWNIHDLSLSTYTEVYEMVTAVCYSPDGQDSLVGTHKGNYRLYDCKMEEKSQVETQSNISQMNKITGFQFHPNNPSEVLVTCADSRIRIFNGEVVVHKFKGFKNTSSQIAASFCKDGKYVISASEDSQVYLWKREGQRVPGSGKGKIRIKTRSNECFFCKDVSVAIPWPGSEKCEPQVASSASLNSKKHSKSFFSLPSSDSPSTENNKGKLPPRPKKEEEAGAQVSRQASSRSDSGVGGSSNSDTTPVDSGRFAESPSTNAASNQSSSSSAWSWWEGVRGHGNSEKVTAWGLVIVTAGLAGEIRVYQNFGVPRRLTHQVTLFMNKEN